VDDVRGYRGDGGQSKRGDGGTVDWSKVRRNPESIKMPQAERLLLRDCVQSVRRLLRLASEGAELKWERLAAGPVSGWEGGGGRAKQQKEVHHFFRPSFVIS